MKRLVKKKKQLKKVILNFKKYYMDMPADLNAQYSEQMIIDNPSWQSVSQDVIKSAQESFLLKKKQSIFLMENELKTDWTSEDVLEKVKLDFVWDTLVLIYDWEVRSLFRYSEKYWNEIFFNLRIAREQNYNGENFFFMSQYLAGYLEQWNKLIPLKNTDFESIDQVLDESYTPTIQKKWGEINMFNEDWTLNGRFVRIFNDIAFYNDIAYLKTNKNAVKKWKTLDIPSDSIYQSIVSWAFRIKDVVWYYSQWCIEKDKFLNILKKAILELPKQCADKRFYKDSNWKRVWFEVTKDELDEYLNPTEWDPLITQETYDRCIKIIEERDKLIKDKKAQKVKTSAEIWEIRANWIIDWARKMIKWIID